MSKAQIFQQLMRTGKYSADEAAELANKLADDLDEPAQNKLASFVGDAGRITVDRGTRQLLPDTTQIGKVAADQPARISQSGGNTIVGIAKWGSLGTAGTAGAIFGVPAASETLNNYFDRQTQEEISQNRNARLQAIADVLNDEEMSYEEKMAVIDAINQLGNRPTPGDDGNDNPFSIELPVVGDIVVSPGMILAIILILVLVAYVGRYNQ